MAKMRSLGEGAKRAGEATTSVLRKLFGRQPSATDNSSSQAGSVTGDDDAISDGHRQCASHVNTSRSNGDCNHSTSVPQENTSFNPGHAETARRGPSTEENGHSQEHAQDLGEQSIALTTPSSSAKNDNRSTMDGNALPNGNMTGGTQRQPSQMMLAGKENQNPDVSGLTSQTETEPHQQLGTNELASSMKGLSLGPPFADAGAIEAHQQTGERVDSNYEEELTDEEKAFRAEREKHLVFIEEALDMARLALKTNETPVGCVLVHNDKVIARGMNATNVTRNGTRHAEFMAICALLSYPPKHGPRTTCLKPKMETNPGGSDGDDDGSTAAPSPDEGNEDGSKGHIYPYGQKEHPDERVDRSIIRECTLYVTVEPCIMCASLLRQLGIKKVFFGAVNDKFGGTGGVFSIHANSLPVREDGQTASAHPAPPPMRLPNGNQVLGTSFPPGGGDGGNVEPGFEIEGGWGRDEAVGLLRRFYVQENGRAPVPRKKEGRAARLAAMMEKDDDGSLNSGSADAEAFPDGDDLAPSASNDDGPSP